MYSWHIIKASRKIGTCTCCVNNDVITFIFVILCIFRMAIGRDKLCFVTLLLFGLSNAIEIREGVVFNKVNDIILSRSRWLMTFIVDLDSYKTFLDKISVDIENANGLAVIMSERYTKLGHANYLSIFNAIKNEIRTLRQMYDTTVRNYKDYNTLRDNSSERKKRAVFGFGGKILNFLFGTLTQDDLDIVQKHVSTLEANQQSIVHVLEDSLTILNMSRTEIAENRHSINEILSTLSDINNKIDNVTEELNNQLNEVENFLQMYLKLDLIVEELKLTIQNALIYLENLKIQVSMLSNEKLSPLIISPMKLKATLQDIASKLPRAFRLPDNLNTNLWKYYTYLKCATIISNNQIIIVVSVPILDFSSKFEVYNIHTFPVALTNTSQTQMIAQVDSDTSIIAFNNERTKYILLNHIEAQECSSPWRPFCEFQSPVYSVARTERCIIFTFLNQKENINNHCKTVVKFDSALPFATFVGHNNWLIATSQPLQFSIVCHNNSITSIQINPPVGILNVKTSCVASNGFFSLVSPFDGRSKYQLEDTMADFMNIQFDKIPLNLWRPLQTSFPNISKIEIPGKLKEIKQIPMETLIRELHNLGSLQKKKYEMPSWVYVLIAVIIALACIAVVVLCCKYRERIKKYWLAKRVGNGRKKAGSPLPGNHDSAMEKSIGMDSAAQWGTLTLNEETVKPDKLQRLGKQTVNIDVLSA